MSESEHQERCLLYHYGELGDEESRLFKDHLEDCAACNEHLAFLKETSGNLKGLRAEPPSEVCEKILERAGAFMAPEEPRRTFIPWTALAFAGLAAMFSVLLLRDGIIEKPPSPPGASLRYVKIEPGRYYTAKELGFEREPILRSR